MHLRRLFIGFFGTGSLPYPRLSASVLATILGLIILHYTGMETLFMLAFVITIIAVFEVNRYLMMYPDANRSKITISDATGVWMSLLITLSTAFALNIPYAIYIGSILSLVSFLFFQTWKPSTIGWMYRTLKGGLGILLGNIFAGLGGGLLGALLLMILEKLL